MPLHRLSEDIEASLASIPFSRSVGTKLVKTEGAHCHEAIDEEPRFRARDGEGGYSAGLVAAVLDQLGSGALTLHFGERLAKATLSMSLSFADELVAPGCLHLVGRAPFSTEKTGAVEVAAEAEDGTVIANGLVSYMIGTYPGAPDKSPPKDHTHTAIRDEWEPERVEAGDFDEWMGIEHRGSESHLDWATRLTGSTSPVVAFHGGIVAATAISNAEQMANQSGGFFLSHFTMEYLRAARNKRLAARSEIVHESRRSLAVRTEVVQEEGTRHVATATMRFVR